MSKRKITIDDLLALKWVSDPQLSPVGSRLVFVQTVVDRDADTYRSHLWVVPVDGGALRQFTAGEHRDSLPRWSPDGRWILMTQLDRDTSQNVWLLDASGTKAPTLLVRGPRRDNAGSVSPDGHWMVFPAPGSPSVGAWVSRTWIVWLAVVVLPHASRAVQVRVTS